MLKFRRMTLTAAACAAGLLAASAAVAQAPANPPAAAPAPPAAPFAGYKPGDVRVYMSPALRAAMDKTKPQAEAAIGRKLVIEMSQAALLQKGIEEGQPFEVALLTKPVMDAVVVKNRIVPASQVLLADLPLGMAARGDLSKVDIKTSTAMKKTLLGAKGVRRNYGVGASVPLVEHVVKTLDVDAALKDKYIAMVGAPQPIPEQTLAAGEYEVMLNMASEVMGKPGWTYVSPVPPDLRLPTIYAAGVGPLGDQATAKALMTFLKGPVFTKALADTGMTPIS